MQAMPTPPKQTFAALDGVRGIAALAVMMFHIAWWPHFGRPFPSAYLAVDLFFALSGFVVAHAYSPRLSQGLSPLAFLRVRVVRLWPLYALGLAAGITAVVGLRLSHDQAVSAGNIFRHLGFHLLFLPLLVGGAMTGQLFPFNGPSWSLSFEVLINAVYGAVHRLLSPRLLTLFLPVGAGALLLAAVQYRGLDAGYQWASVLVGVPRVAFSFAMGLLLHSLWSKGRLPALPHRWTAPLLLASALATVGLLLYAPPRGWRPLYDWSVVVAAWPLLMVLWVRLRPQGRADRACGLLGRLSYPAYVLHVPVGRLVLLAATAGFGLHATQATTSVWLTTVALTVILSLAATRFYDPPVRAALGRLLSMWSRSHARPAAA
jgi:peptidoglycan/LPS O-acetylase OafA/YrhL